MAVSARVVAAGHHEPGRVILFELGHVSPERLVIGRFELLEGRQERLAIRGFPFGQRREVEQRIDRLLDLFDIRAGEAVLRQ